MVALGAPVIGSRASAWKALKARQEELAEVEAPYECSFRTNA